MTKFFVDFQDNDTYREDDEGDDFPGLDQARKEVIDLLAEIARSKLYSGEHRKFVAIVRDENGTPLYRASLIFHDEQLAP